MTNQIWEYVAPYFSPEEQWGNPERISGLLLLVLHWIRITSGWPMVIHCAYESRPRGLHPRGMACDFHFAAPPGGLSIVEQAERLEAFLAEMQLADYVGLGVYPDWNSPGFHLDVRGERARRGRIGTQYVTWERAIIYAQQILE